MLEIFPGAEENPRKTIGKCWFSGILCEFMGFYMVVFHGVGWCLMVVGRDLASGNDLVMTVTVRELEAMAKSKFSEVSHWK